MNRKTVSELWELILGYAACAEEMGRHPAIAQQDLTTCFKELTKSFEKVTGYMPVATKEQGHWELVRQL